jgi:hypothetical protein
MTKQEVIDLLVADGYTDRGSYQVYNAHLVFKRLPKRVTDVAPCLTNEHKVSFEVRIHDPLPMPNSRHSCSVHIVGQYAEGRWCDLNVYSESLDDIAKHFQHHEDDLASAWESMCYRRSRIPNSDYVDVEEND